MTVYRHAGSLADLAQLIAEVHMQPLTAGRPRVHLCKPNEFSGNASSLKGARDLRVEEKRMIATVPRDVHEADEGSIEPRGHPSKTERLDAIPPSGGRGVASVVRRK